MAEKRQPHNLRDMFNYLGQDAGVKELGFKMYGRVWKDNDNPWFSGQFVRSAPFDHAARQLVLFVGQQVGGGDMWGGFRQEPKNIIGIHRNFICGPKSKDRWIMHMEGALEDMDLMPFADDAKRILLKWFNSFADQVVNCDQATEDCYMEWVDYEIRVNGTQMEKATVIARDKALANKHDRPPKDKLATAPPLAPQHIGEPPTHGVAAIVTDPKLMTPRFNTDEILKKAGIENLKGVSTADTFEALCRQLEQGQKK